MITLRADFAELASLQASYAMAPDVTMEELARVAEVSATELEAAIKEKTPTAHGTLRASIFPEVRQLAAGFGVEAIVGTSLNYAPYVELGTRPHMPPIAPLIDWVKAKGLDIGLIGTSKRARKSRDDVAERIARRIQWKIFRYGTEGQHMFEGGFKEALPRIQAHAAEAARRIARRLAGGKA